MDYSKLKRGRKEYQQFLQEQRKADPEAFAPQPTGPSKAGLPISGNVARLARAERYTSLRPGDL